jgi:hypothetical protein
VVHAFTLSMSKNVIRPSTEVDWKQQQMKSGESHSARMEDSQYLTTGYGQCCPSSSASTSTSTSALPSPVSELTEFDLSTRNGGSSRASPDTSVDGDSDEPLPVSSIILGGGVFVSVHSFENVREGHATRDLTSAFLPAHFQASSLTGSLCPSGRAI